MIPGLTEVKKKIAKVNNNKDTAICEICRWKRHQSVINDAI